MRDKTHNEFIENCAHYVKTHNDWKKIHTKFIDAQFDKAYEFMHRLLKEKNGKEKIIKL